MFGLRARSLGLCTILAMSFLYPSFAAAQSGGQCSKPNLLMMVDRSGSMLKNNKWTIATAGITALTNSNATRLRMGLLTFADKATLDASIPSTAQAIQAALKLIIPKGDTYMLPAATLGRSHIELTIQNDLVTGRPTSILLVSDGAPSDRCPVAEITALRSLKINGVVYDIKTYVVGFGTQVNPICLNNLATAGGTALPGTTKYYVAANQADFTKIVSNIATTSSQEICNGLDDDCDGTVDNVKGTGTTLQRICQKGRCSGIQLCTSGKWGSCAPNPPPTTENCNGRDDDCDGYVDNKVGSQKDFTLTQTCTGACGKGIQLCAGGQWSLCTANSNIAEQCNGKDDDCDGRIDNVKFTTLKIEQRCKAGLCAGKQTCTSGAWGSCKAAAPPSSEICNGKDDNCDGFIDNTSGTTQNSTLKKPCKTRCGSGTVFCTAGRWQGCTAPREIGEICNKKDDDCDGKIDNVLGTNKALSKYCVQGRCAGRSYCLNGVYQACKPTVTPKAEICNYRDDNCDGYIDNGPGIKRHWSLQRSCKTNCGVGKQTCYAGVWRTCSSAPKVEVCNGKDDDCDGKIDNRFHSGRALYRYCRVGGCSGSQVCQNAKWTACRTNITPSPEKCNNRDDDCDGYVDNRQGIRQHYTYTEACTTSCGTGTKLCYKGKFKACIVQGKKETCDNKDNDCDGRIDNVYNTNRGIEQSCTVNGCGGTQVCSSGNWGSCSANASSQSLEQCNGKDDDCDGKVDNVKNTNNPMQRFCVTNGCDGAQTCVSGNWAICQPKSTSIKQELCNGKDDDCDGIIDNKKGSTTVNSLTQPCKTGCGTGTETCIQGVWQNCTAKAPVVEICNGKDDDCDGAIDEDWKSNLNKACKTPCGRGFFKCQPDGKDLYCAAPNVSPEICDGKDNDCDGKVDENWPSKGKVCSAGSGACQKAGVFVCTADEQNVECSAKAPNNPAPEVCDGIDNDCDGRIDENIKRPCTQPCGQGQETCKEGKWSKCSGASQPQKEVCDGKDNDCNGVIDDNLTRACTTSCGTGNQVCQKGTWSTCSVSKPKKEICDNKDNDCNGIVDDGLTQGCRTDCGTGTETCKQGKWQFCDAPKPRKEICNGKDSDCNGKVDDGIKPRACKGDCGVGTASCVKGQWGGCSVTQPEPETCDNKDNDCNGKVDDGLERDCKTVCGEGKETCTAGLWSGCTATPPEKEICNGKDDDCNGQIDNNVTCEAGKSCVQGECRRECRNGECPAGESCVNNVCLPDENTSENTSDASEPSEDDEVVSEPEPEPIQTDRIIGASNGSGESDIKPAAGCDCTAVSLSKPTFFFLILLCLGLLTLRRRFYA